MEIINRCTRCVMDTTVENITFNEKGVCNYCTECIDLLNEMNYFDKAKKELMLSKIINEIKQAGKGKAYDCIVGISGGIDSSYCLYKVRKLGLKPLAVHLDNGWDTDLSVSNIKKLVDVLNVDLYTHVIDWEEFKNLQIAFFKSNVIDIEALTDHAITAILFKVAYKRGIKYVLAGTNIATEGMRMPANWSHNAKILDLKNIIAIYNRFGNGTKLKTFPTMGFIKFFMYSVIYGIKWVSILNYLDYEKEKAIDILGIETGWKPYEKKHYESVFTRFYQGYILPRKFNVDKRKIHFSTLICSGQMSREEAINRLNKDPYDDQFLLKEDKEYVMKKLGFSDEFFEEYMKNPPMSHNSYPSNMLLFSILKQIRPKRWF